ncbi:MAG: hypothetical protein BECKG1743D_GA0114223_109403 [Candidatus Kentron sp. G]|nr:MAG: hypothetical protein BECKG1743E_GA0114224_109732 [Candidatus Kentron sp. G]VFN06934.1 MAG: hypothetical protein BECKG1743D_GA0114223_109403 [Candidatus Kentron sp. G]
MATFPNNESGILELAKNIVRGLTDNSPVYPSPPVGPLDLETRIDAYEKAREDIVAARGVLKEAVDAKNTALGELKDDVRRDLRYAENTVDKDDTKLSLLGWGGPRPPTPLEPPGQASNLQATSALFHLDLWI